MSFGVKGINLLNNETSYIRIQLLPFQNSFCFRCSLYQKDLVRILSWRLQEWSLLENVGFETYVPAYCAYIRDSRHWMHLQPMWCLLVGRKTQCSLQWQGNSTGLRQDQEIMRLSRLQGANKEDLLPQHVPPVPLTVPFAEGARCCSTAEVAGVA